MFKIATFRTALALLAALSTVCSIDARCYGALVAAERVVVDISGDFSADPSAILLNGNPGPFPSPGLLGGSFAGQFEYAMDSMGIIEGNGVVREFYITAVKLEVRDNLGALVHTIRDAPNPFKISDGTVIFGMGPSFQDQPGHAALTPTDLRFNLSGSFVKASTKPPSAAALNGASVGQLFGYGPFVELDSTINPFYGWDLPITTLSLSARDVPESPAIVGLGWIFAVGCAFRVRAFIPARL